MTRTTRHLRVIMRGMSWPRDPAGRRQLKLRDLRDGGSGGRAVWPGDECRGATSAGLPTLNHSLSVGTVNGPRFDAQAIP